MKFYIDETDRQTLLLLVQFALDNWDDAKMGLTLPGDLSRLRERLAGPQCSAVFHHGPGHQSTTRCYLSSHTGEHEAEAMGRIVGWTGDEGWE